MNIFNIKNRLVFLLSIFILVIIGSFVWMKWKTEIIHYIQSNSNYESEGLGVLRNPSVNSKYLGNTENLVKYSFILPKLKTVTRISTSSNMIFSLIPENVQKLNVFDAEFSNGAKGNNINFITKYSKEELLEFYKNSNLEVKNHFLNQEKGFIELENNIFIIRINFILNAKGEYLVNLTSVNK